MSKVNLSNSVQRGVLNLYLNWHLNMLTMYLNFHYKVQIVVRRFSVFLYKNLEDISLFCGQWYPCCGLLVTFTFSATCADCQKYS